MTLLEVLLIRPMMMAHTRMLPVVLGAGHHGDDDTPNCIIVYRRDTSDNEAHAQSFVCAARMEIWQYFHIITESSLSLYWSMHLHITFVWPNAQICNKLHKYFVKYIVQVPLHETIREA